MKVALLVDYYTPFTPGGSEWSVYYLAKQFKTKGIETTIITPNYGAKAQEIVDEIQVRRFPILKRPKDNRSVISPIWQNNPLFFLWSSYQIFKIAKKEKINILHVNGKFLIPGAWIAAKILKKPLVVSIRDKQLLCSYGHCFFQDRYKACNFFEYLFVEMPWYYQNYSKNKGLFSMFFILASGIYSRLANKIIRFFATKADRIVTISNSQKKYMEVNGFKNIQVIYNSFIFSNDNKLQERRGVLFAGKLSLGKGVYLLLNSIPKVLNKHKETFVFAGVIEEKEKIDELVKKLKIKKNVKFLGGVNHYQLQKLYHKSKVVVMPSIYPEAFGRVALEGIAAGTPAIVVNKGGLPEIIEPSVTGEISKLESHDLADKLIRVLEKNKMYIQNVLRSHEKLKAKFELRPISQHVSLYKELIK